MIKNIEGGNPPALLKPKASNIWIPRAKIRKIARAYLFGSPSFTKTHLLKKAKD
jgi:hypothetical protein